MYPLKEGQHSVLSMINLQIGKKHMSSRINFASMFSHVDWSTNLVILWVTLELGN